MARKALIAAVCVAILVGTQPAWGSGPPKNFLIHDSPKALPNVQFEDGESNRRALSDFTCKVVLLNVWATWCAPCRLEMPTLDRLQGALGGSNFQVIALSVDRAGANAVAKFYRETGIKNLGRFIDGSGTAARELGAVGLPTTILVDRNGREIGRLVGPAEWDSPEMLTLIRSKLDKPARSSLAQ